MSSAASIHEGNASGSVRTNKERKAENARKKQVNRDKKQRAKTGQVSPGGRSKVGDTSTDYNSDNDGRKNSRANSSSRGGGGGGGGRRMPTASHGGASPVGLVQIFTLVSAIGVLIIGFWVVIDAIDSLDVCDDDTDGVECYMSELLFWDIDGFDETSSSLNAHWRGVFSFVPSTFIPIWTPMFFGVISCLQMVSGMEWYLISGNWIKVMLWHIVMALFACFGYVGQAGLVVGTIVSVTAILCFIARIAKWGGHPYITIG